MPDQAARSTDLAPGRPARGLGLTLLLAMAAAQFSAGCAGTASLIRPVLDRTTPPTGPRGNAPPPTPESSPKRDVSIMRAQASAPPQVSGLGATSSPGPADPSQPPPPAPNSVATSPYDQPVQADDSTTLYRYDPMRGAAVSREPPPNRNVTLRELLGLGRSDIADLEIEVKPRYPRLHDDPLARSPVAPAERDRPPLPALSNLIFEHDRELKEDADDARDDVLERRSKRDVTFPGPDTANFPNSAYTLPKGRAYIETSPLNLIGKSRSFPAQYNWEFLLRYGLTDDLEFRLFSPGYSATMSRPHTTGFSPLTFDLKYHLWDENLEKHIPAAGAEIYIQTPFGSDFFNGGTQPSIALLLDHTLPFDVLLEHNFGLTGIQDTFGESVYEFSYQWALQRQVFKDFAIFTHGFLNSSALPRLPVFQRHVNQISPSAVVVGGGFLWNLSRRLAVFGSYNAGLGGDAPRIIGQFGFAIAL